jgi:hypothetical protein
VLPVLNERSAPTEAEMSQRNEELLGIDG